MQPYNRRNVVCKFNFAALIISGLALASALAVGLRDHAVAQTAVPVARYDAPGRYEIVHSPHLERDTMLLDTETGRTWGLVIEKDDSYAWEPNEWIGH